MPPVQEISIRWVIGGKEERAVGVFVADVFDACAAFGECCLAVCYDGGGAHGVKGLEVGGCEEGRAFVLLEIIFDAEFFAEPGDAL